MNDPIVKLLKAFGRLMLCIFSFWFIFWVIGSIFSYVFLGHFVSIRGAGCVAIIFVILSLLAFIFGG